ANTYDGPTVISGGTLKLQGDQTLTGFGGNGSGWTLNGGAPSVTGDILTLTTGSSQSTSAYYNTKVPVNQPFVASFVMNYNGDTHPADAVSFILQNSGLNATGNNYYAGGITPSAAIVLDTWNDRAWYQANGSGSVDMANPNVLAQPIHQLKVDLNYDGSNLLTVVLTDQVNSANYTHTYTVGSLATQCGGTTAYLGLVGGIGGHGTTYKISNFVFTFPGVGSNNLPVGTALSMASATTFNLNGNTQQVAALADASGSPSGQQVLLGSGTLTVGDATSTTFSGALVGSGALTKAGAGTLTLAGTSTYTGATSISGGTLRVQGALGATATTVSATLSGNGSINAGVSLLAGGGFAARISNWTGVAGSGFEDLSVQSLAIAAGSHAVTIDTAGLTNFTDTTKVFAFLTTTAGITGFNAGDFSISAPGLSGSGTWALRQTGNNLELVYSNGAALPPYDSWAAAMGLTGAPGKESGFDADPDKDGIANGLEWILGGNPLANDRAIQPVVTSNPSSGLTLRFNHAESSIGQATLVVQWAINLNGIWTDVPVTQGGGSYANGVVVTVNQAATPDAVTVNIPATNAAGGKIFARLKATNP
ncbi:MAG: autotransporter-associated beta strand repeat-containing protein, partial [Verrucomicrobiota bacterium]